MKFAMSYSGGKESALATYRAIQDGHELMLLITILKDLAEEIAETGADICGENGEYHTFVSDGPIFKTPVVNREGV